MTEDLNTARNALLNETSRQTPNGQTESIAVSEVDLNAQTSNLITKVLNYLKEPSQLPNGDATSNGLEDIDDAIQPNPRTGHVLSLRTQTSAQTPLLYSGLQNQSKTADNNEDDGDVGDGLSLPNGFDLTDFSALNGGTKTQKFASRSFGEVFGLPSNARVKPLEEPQPSRNSTRLNQLRFTSPSTRKSSKDKVDYKDAELSIGKWITNRFSNSRKTSQSGVNNFKSDEGFQVNSADDGDILFRSAYSSFAPTSDNTDALISSEDMGQYWWRKSGARKILTPLTTDNGQVLGEDGEITHGLQDFDNILENWIPGEDEALPITESNEDKDANDLLEEVSDLIETLSSYQRNRSLKASGQIPAPSEAEFDVFELLQTQIRLLVDALPPFAVAKLNGDQLEELNISTNILVKAPEFAGTGQLDEYASSKQRASAAAVVPNRPVGPVQVRPNYVPPPTNTPGFNMAARGYNASVPGTAAYGMRATTNYQTPTTARAPFSQTPYQSQNTPFSSRATIQQYQRQLQNGLGNYANTPVQAQTPSLAQRPTQPGYQQRAQDSAMALGGRPGSPQKPMMNGQTYTPRGLTQNPEPFQRPNSGTPMTPSYAKVAAAVRYDGAADGQNREIGGVGEGQSPAKSQPQPPAIAAVAAMSQSQTVEVSR